MVRVTLIFITLTLLAQSADLKKDCLKCHKEQKIPSYVTYKRYLMKYSTKEKIADAMFKYLKNPKKENSVLPPQFFLKFSIKKPTSIDDETLKKDIESFIEKFDVKRRLILEK